jgi:hypothetical protein
MRVRWSDQEDALNWTPSALNQAGSLELSRGSEIVTAVQARQEVLVWTDSALYSLQYLGAPEVWGAQIMGENISIVSQNCAVYMNGTAYWMGLETFYRYDGTVNQLPCTLDRYVFNDINYEQLNQVIAGINARFNEIWWFYCSAGSTTVDRYVIYNYASGIWYHGNMSRSAWFGSGLRRYPVAATYLNNLVYHEQGYDNVETDVAVPITASITSAQFDIGDGDKFAFIWRVLPDVTFEGSTVNNPSLNLSLLPLANSGSGYNNPLSQGGVNEQNVARGVTVPVETFTGQVNIRVRGRQLSIKLESTGLGVAWQMGSPRVDMRLDGRA